jgi:hypothetical protein
MPPASDLELTGQHLAQLQAALVAAFPNRFAFRQLTQYQLELDLDKVVGEGPINEVAFALIEWARAQGKLAQLIGGARAENSGNPELKAFADRIGIQPVVLATAPSPAEANRGLTALGDLMDAGDARDAVRAFETEFQEAVEQIDVLSVFKDVHDLLHTLQFRCFDGLARQTSRFPDDDLAREIVNEHGVTLEETIARLDAIICQRAFEDGKPRWVEDLREARAQISGALDTSSAQPLNRAVRLLDRVLAVQPTRINTRLNDSARALRLRDLVADLGKVHGRLGASNLDPAKMSEFEAGIKSLQQLDLALGQVVAEHDRWQELDVELRLERNAFLVSADGLDASWPRLRAQLLPLCTGTEAWASRLINECSKLDAALAARDLTNQRSAFLQVHSQAATRFYQVDIGLQRLCETLREIGKPLTGLLRKLQ